MIRQHTRRGVEARVRNAPDTHFAIVIGHVLHQPVDAVIRVAAFVNILWRLLIVDLWTHVGELAFRHNAAAHVLIREDIFLSGEQFRRSERRLIVVRAIGRNAVRRPVHKDWIFVG